MYINEPVDQNCTHLLINILLFCHEAGLRHVVVFMPSNLIEDFLGIEGDFLRHASVLIIEICHIKELLLIASLPGCLGLALGARVLIVLFVFWVQFALLAELRHVMELECFLTLSRG